MDDLKIIVFDNIETVGKEVDDYLQKMNNTNESYIMKIKRSKN